MQQLPESFESSSSLNSSPTAKSPNDADGAWKPILTDYKLRQHGLRSGIRRRYQTVLLKIASP
jgi:hypothetical protein